MLYEFLETYKRIKVGGKVKIYNRCLPPNHILYGIVPVHSDFVEYIVNNENLFTVRTIQELYRWPTRTPGHTTSACQPIVRLAEPIRGAIRFPVSRL